MTDETIEQLPQEEGQQPAPAVETNDEAAAAAEAEAAAEARKYGWKPKEEFNLAPEGWVDAKRFLELPSTMVKQLRDQKRDLDRQLKERDERLERIGGVTQQAIERVRQQERQQYEAKIAEFERAKREAAELGDVTKYDQLSEQQRSVKPPAPIAAPVAAPANEVQEYLKTTKWAADPAAMTLARGLIDSDPAALTLPPLRQVQWAERKLKEYYPDYFDTPAATATATVPGKARVDAGGLGVITQKRGRTADDLPADARSVGQSFVKDGLFKTLDEYAAAYFEQGA
jgi:hypothetical protein